MENQARNRTSADELVLVPVPTRFLPRVYRLLAELYESAPSPHEVDVPTVSPDRARESIRRGRDFVAGSDLLVSLPDSPIERGESVHARNELAHGRGTDGFEVVSTGKDGGDWTRSDVASLVLATTGSPSAVVIDAIAKAAPRPVEISELLSTTHLGHSELRSHLATVTKHSTDILGQKGRPYLVRVVRSSDEKPSTAYTMPKQLAEWWTYHRARVR